MEYKTSSVIIPSSKEWSGGGMHKFVKYIVKKSYDMNTDVNLVLLQIRSILVGLGFQSPTPLLFNIPIRGLRPKSNRSSINHIHDEDDCNNLKVIKTNI